MCSWSECVRHAPFRRHPGVVGEVRRIDDEHVAVPAADRIAAIGGRHIVAMRTSVGRDQTEPVIRLRQHHDHLRRRDDLSDRADVPEADVQRAERRRHAAQRRIVLVAERLRLRRCLRLIETHEGRRRCAPRAPPRAAAARTAPARRADVAAAPPHAGEIRMPSAMRGAGPAGFSPPAGRLATRRRPPGATGEDDQRPHGSDTIRVMSTSVSRVSVAVSLRAPVPAATRTCRRRPVSQDQLPQHASVLRRVFGVETFDRDLDALLDEPGLKPLRTMPLGVPASKAQRSTLPTRRPSHRGRTTSADSRDGPGRSSPAP